MWKTVLVSAVLSIGIAGFSDVVMDDFSSNPEVLKKCTNGKLAKFLPDGGPEGASAVELVSRKNAMLSLALNVNDLKGKTLVFSGNVKAEKVVTQSKSYLGVKFMIYYKLADGKQQWVETFPGKLRTGTYDWSKISTKATIPESVVDVRVSFGIQETTGKVWFSNLKLETH